IADGGFASSCTNIQIDDTVFLVTKCKNGAGAMVNTKLDLDKCVENSGGTLNNSCPYDSGDFLSSCSGCSIHGTAFGCLCAFPDGQSSSTALDINACVGNNNGQLVC
ncbi:Cyanovirin-N, partial [Mycena epipterygia]